MLLRMVLSATPTHKRAVACAAVGLVLAALALGSVRPAWAESTSPCLNGNAKWRIAYYEGGPWADYKETLLATVAGLMELGWIESGPLPEVEDPADMAQVWSWLCTTARSDYLEFTEDGFYSADWDDGLRAGTRDRMLDELAGGRYDLVWALGTWAGLDLANSGHKVPTMVMSTSNPVTAGIIPNPEDSGFDHVHVRTDPARVQRQVLLFHDVFAFSRLGLIYENTDYGRAYAYLEEVQAAARQAGFELVTCQAPNVGEDGDLDSVMERYVACARRLAPAVDAFLYDDHTGAKPRNVGRTLPIFAHYRVPTWSTRGALLVRCGVLISMNDEQFARVGGFYARTMARILNGARPGDLEQVFRTSFRLVLNTKTAEIIGYDLPPNLIRVTDSLIATIEPPWEQTDGN